MEPAVVGLSECNRDIRFHRPELPGLLQCHGGGHTRRRLAPKELLLRQLTSPVRWSDRDSRTLRRAFPMRCTSRWDREAFSAASCARLVNGAADLRVRNRGGNRQTPPDGGLMNIDLTGKNALVTGSTRGIGRAIAEASRAAARASPSWDAISRAPKRRLRRSATTRKALRADVSDTAAVTKLVADVEAAFGRSTFSSTTPALRATTS